MADIKTSKLVDPAEINGSGKPVGGIKPLNISCCIINLYNKRAGALLFYLNNLSSNIKPFKPAFSNFSFASCEIK